MMTVEAPFDRFVDRDLEKLLSTFAAVMLVGPRSCGKTTSARRLARASLPLDVPARGQLAMIDPDAALLAQPGRPLLIDEWQIAPGILGAVKRSVDGGAPPGSFILTGSVDPGAVEMWPATGRVIERTMGPLAEREIERRVGGASLLDRLAAADPPLGAIADAPNVLGYVDRALRGSFPVPARMRSAVASRSWYSTYAKQIAARDASSSLPRADAGRFGAYLRSYALHVAGVADHASIFRAAGVTRTTADGYDAILHRLYVAASLPPWIPGSPIARLAKRPKRFLADAALAAAAAGLTRDDILADGVQLGRLIESFVFTQLRAEPSVDDEICHLRTEKGRQEIDFIVPLGGGRVLALEVKSASAVGPDDARHLAWLRDEIGDDFVFGAVLHSGSIGFMLGERIAALPIAAFWS